MITYQRSLILMLILLKLCFLFAGCATYDYYHVIHIDETQIKNNKQLSSQQIECLVEETVSFYGFKDGGLDTNRQHSVRGIKIFIKPDNEWAKQYDHLKGKRGRVFVRFYRGERDVMLSMGPHPVQNEYMQSLKKSLIEAFQKVFGVVKIEQSEKKRQKPLFPID